MTEFESWDVATVENIRQIASKRGWDRLRMQMCDEVVARQDPRKVP